MIYAVDFDGTLCIDKFPEIGEAHMELIEFLQREQSAGARLILWTCRCGEHLQQAIDWCHERGLVFDAINENLPEHRALYETDSRKIFADYYIDDRNMLVSPDGDLYQWPEMRTLTGITRMEDEPCKQQH